MALLRNLKTWLLVQSDATHSVLCVSATSCLLPALNHMSPTLLAATNLMAVSAQFGSQIYVAFVGGPTMFLNMNRTAFGDLQSRLFPKYGMVGLSTGMLSLASYHLAHHGAVDVCTYLLGGSLCVYILNSFWIFPVTTKYMMERRAAEKEGVGEEELKRANRRFGISHGISNIVNMSSLAANLGYLYILATRVAGVW